MILSLNNTLTPHFSSAPHGSSRVRFGEIIRPDLNKKSKTRECSGHIFFITQILTRPEYN